MTSYAVRHGDAVRYMSVPAGAFAARHADSRGHRPWKHLDLRKHARTPALRLGQRRITEAEALPCRGRNDSTAASLQAPLRAGTYDLPGPSQNAWPNSFRASYGNIVSSPVIVKLVAPHATLTGQTGAVLAIFAVAALHAYILAATTIEGIARKLLQADGFTAKAPTLAGAQGDHRAAAVPAAVRRDVLHLRVRAEHHHVRIPRRSSCIQLSALVAANAWTRDHNGRCFTHRVRASVNASVARPAIPGWLPRLCVPWPRAGTARRSWSAPACAGCRTSRSH